MKHIEYVHLKNATNNRNHVIDRGLNHIADPQYISPQKSSEMKDTHIDSVEERNVQNWPKHDSNCIRFAL